MQTNNKLLATKLIIDNESASVNLFFITREIKEGVAKSAKVIDKYKFKAWRTDISPELVSFFIEISKRQVNRVAESTDYTLEPYDVISDDLPNKLYTYALNNALAFSDVVTNQINSGSPSPIASLSQVKNDLWAYALKINGPTGSALIFRKISKGKIVTDKNQSMLESISSYFDSATAELKIAIQENISFDNKLDCIFIENEFLVFRKSSFESIVGLEDEFSEAANDVLNTIKSTDLVEGIEHIESQLTESRALLKTLSNIAKKGHHHNLNPNEIEKMKVVLKTFEGKDLKLTEQGKLLLEDKKDVGDFVKLLNDYYKQGMVSGKFYGTNSGQMLAISS